MSKFGPDCRNVLNIVSKSGWNCVVWSWHKRPCQSDLIRILSNCTLNAWKRLLVSVPFGIKLLLLSVTFMKSKLLPMSVFWLDTPPLVGCLRPKHLLMFWMKVDVRRSVPIVSSDYGEPTNVILVNVLCRLSNESQTLLLFPILL